MERKTNKRYCIAFGCYNSNRNVPDLTLFKLPKDSERRREWLTFIGREDLLTKENLKYNSYLVCSDHFKKSSIKLIKQLKNDAVPTYRICADAESDSSTSTSFEESNTISIGTQTETYKFLEKSAPFSIDLPEDNSRKRILLQTDKNQERKRIRLKHKLNKIKKELEVENYPIIHASSSDIEYNINERFKKIIDWHKKLRKKFKGNRYDLEYKTVTLNLYYSSPYTYRCFQSVLRLPSKSTLNKFQLKITPKLDSHVLDSLSMKIKSLPEKAKYCSICIDTMVLKRNLCYDTKKDEVIGFQNVNGKISPEIASCAYVIMLQSIYFNWKQPIAYAFLASTKNYVELDEWICEVIRKLLGLGIRVKAVISDQGTCFDKYAKEVKNITIDNPYFVVDGFKIYYIFDVPNLLKSVRNNLLLSNLNYNEKKISWDHIKMLYKDQKQKNLVLIPKLTDAHIEPNTLQRMRTKYAAQIFSTTVYAALETYIDFGKMSEDARETAKFIKTMDNLFDILNSYKIKSAKKFQNAFKMSQQQKIILDEAQNMFARIKSVNSNTGEENINQTKTFINFQISIQSIWQLFTDLKQEGFQRLFTRRLNQDSLRNFFKSVRQDGSCTEPTPVQFARAFSKLFLQNMLKYPSSLNSKFDFYEILRKAEDIMKTKIIVPDDKPRTSLITLKGETDYRMDLPEVNAVTYVTSYLIFKCSEKHNCEEMQKKINTMASLVESELFTQFNAFNKTAPYYVNLKIPTQAFTQYVDKLETTYLHNFEKCINKRPGSTIFELLKQIPPVQLCPCFPTDLFLTLFIRLRIFATLRYNNNFCFKGGKRTTKQYLTLIKL